QRCRRGIRGDQRSGRARARRKGAHPGGVQDLPLQRIHREGSGYIAPRGREGGGASQLPCSALQVASLRARAAHRGRLRADGIRRAGSHRGGGDGGGEASAARDEKPGGGLSSVCRRRITVTTAAVAKTGARVLTFREAL